MEVRGEGLPSHVVLPVFPRIGGLPGMTTWVIAHKSWREQDMGQDDVDKNSGILAALPSRGLVSDVGKIMMFGISQLKLRKRLCTSSCCTEGRVSTAESLCKAVARQHLQEISVFEHDWLYMYMTSVHWSLTQFTPAAMDVVPRTVLPPLHFLKCERHAREFAGSWKRDETPTRLLIPCLTLSSPSL